MANRSQVRLAIVFVPSARNQVTPQGGRAPWFCVCSGKKNQKPVFKSATALVPNLGDAAACEPDLPQPTRYVVPCLPRDERYLQPARPPLPTPSATYTSSRSRK